VHDGEVSKVTAGHRRNLANNIGGGGNRPWVS
jgi:hypothetical protein